MYKMTKRSWQEIAVIMVKNQGDLFMDISYLTNRRGQKIAYTYSKGTNAALPCVMFLGGFKSDMSGTKAIFLEAQCRARGQSFVRFDYTGHGLSDGKFEDGTIGAWHGDARRIFDSATHGDVVLVGSSMGGWISLLFLREGISRIKGVIGIAAAPDFTLEIEERMSDAQKKIMQEKGRLEIPSEYGEPYIFTKALLEDGKRNCLLHESHDISVPLILLQGKKDVDVPWQKALRIQEMFKGNNTEVIFIEDGDHRLSRDEDLAVLDAAVRKISGL